LLFDIFAKQFLERNIPVVGKPFVIGVALADHPVDVIDILLAH
jgi:hypothetical protein